MKLPIAEHDQWMNGALDALNRNDSLTAKTLVEKVLRAVPRHALATLTLGVAQANLGQGREALAALEHAVQLAPDDAMFRYNFAVTLAQLGFEDHAMLEYRACLRLDPEHPDALWNYGEMLRLREHFTSALKCFERLLANKRHYLSLHHRTAVCCNALGLDKRARELFEIALKKEPDDLTHWEYAHFLLARGEFAAGWKHYAHRFDCGQRIAVFCAKFPYPEWDGSAHENSVLLVHGEQGYGDEIMFAGYLPRLLQLAAPKGMRIILGCRPALVSLLETSFPGLDVVAHQIDKPADIAMFIGNAGDIFHCPIGSLPLHVGPLPAIPPQAYLSAPKQLLAAFAGKLEKPADKPRLKVGLMWGANPGVKSQHGQQRNLPVRLLNKLAGLDGVRFVSLQNAERGDEIADAPDLDCIDLSRNLNNFADTAALIANLDLVITVCTSVAHLSAAMGKETWVLLQHRAEWRWGRNRNDSVWYSQARLFRQSEPGDWHGMLREVHAALESRLSARE
jgi:Tfp pilus assembly protein PilF